MVEITAKEQNPVKRMKRIEASLRDLWNKIKCANIWVIGIPEEEEKKKGYEKNFEEIIVENFPNREKEIVNQVQEVQRVPYRINARRNTPQFRGISFSDRCVWLQGKNDSCVALTPLAGSPSSPCAHPWLWLAVHKPRGCGFPIPAPGRSSRITALILAGTTALQRDPRRRWFYCFYREAHWNVGHWVSELNVGSGYLVPHRLSVILYFWD